jgi:hypothetical protein
MGPLVRRPRLADVTAMTRHYASAVVGGTNDDAAIVPNAQVPSVVLQVYPDDFQAFGKWASQRRRASIGRVLLSLVIICVGALVLIALAAAFVVGVVATVVLCASVIAYRRLFLRHWRSTRDEACANQTGVLTTSHDGLTVESPTSVRFFRWSHFVGIVDTGPSLWLKCGSRTGQLVPKRSFPSDADARAFAAYADREIQQAHEATNTDAS